MVIKCEDCDKEFSKPSLLKQHQARKTSCREDSQYQKDYKCEKCDKEFRFGSSLSRHRHTCKGPRLTVEQLQAENTELRSQTRQLIITNNVNNVQNVNIDNSINITINNYGQESQAHLERMSYADLKRVLKLTPDHDSLVRMISFIHLNDQVPENRTIRLNDKDSAVIDVFKRGRWREQNADTVLYDLICRNRLRFVDLEEILSKNMAKGKFDELTGYLMKAEDMANSENADLHLEYAFQDLMYQIRCKVAA